MPRLIPFVPSQPRQEFSVELNDVSYIFSARWNARSGTWYLDILGRDRAPILLGVRLVLGALIGARHADLEFNGELMVSDLSGDSVEATLDDLGTRVVVYYFEPDE